MNTCPYGHPRTEKNVTSSGRCRECRRINNIESYRRQNGLPPLLNPAFKYQRLFWSKVDVPSLEECWTFNGSRNAAGYGIAPGGQSRLAHRLAYEWLVGPIPDGLSLDHVCRNHPCVNPAHLDPVTHAENMARGIPNSPKKTYCLRGHELTEENLLWDRKRGVRRCKACNLIRLRRWQRENRDIAREASNRWKQNNPEKARASNLRTKQSQKVRDG